MFHQSRSLQQFNNHVGLKFQLYNSLFTALPFHRIEKTGILLSLLLNHCEEGYKKNQSPVQILEDFFNRYVTVSNDREKADMLFRFVQYVERQVVLFDALEDAAFREVHDISGMGTLKHLASEIQQAGAEDKLAKKLKDFSIRLVLTAHPTQFYPGSVLGIINDLARALNDDNTSQVNMYLRQLGKTPFYKKQKPTPYDEAISLLWYLENVFYSAAGKIISNLRGQFPHALSTQNPVITMGFWPGGDRDGNPNVTTETTVRVAEALRSAIIKCYYQDVRRLKRRLTFKGLETIVADLEVKLYNNIFVPNQRTDISSQEIYETLQKIREIIIYEHNGLFVHLVDNLMSKVGVFGLYFAALDIRQESSVHNQVLEAISLREDLLPKNYNTLNEEEKLALLTNCSGSANIELYEDGVIKDTMQSMTAIRSIQQHNGENGCNRYIISQCNSALNVIEVFGLFLLNGWKTDELTVDIVPLFETIDDLQNASKIMSTLYTNPVYHKHLKRRKNRQTIMVGFSDGTKDGGYLMANWGIYKAKEELTRISREHGIEVVFFDGRGGPPARGGGKTHQFYASMGKNISSEEIQLTIQGQTISSNFGTDDSAGFNIEQLLNAGISNELFSTKEKTLSTEDDQLIQELSNSSFEAYKTLKNHPCFLSYLAYVSPLNFYGETNIGSRPTRRGSSRLTLKDLRAIPFVGAWSQLKQNVTGYYGVGTALKAAESGGQLNKLKALYASSLYFKTLIDNCEMAMKKCFFPLTAYLSAHPQYGEIWRMIFDEYQLTEKYLLKLTGNSKLMEGYPVESLSIEMRERIVLPLTTIQQYAISRIRDMEARMVKDVIKDSFERLVVRTSFGIINAGRNSA
ncbi:phosphoenolpyruvate carboxylase [Segetibacter sp. 3557_3]|uniref:phosphoenolpyruvate carboxylase n=1 Tax=Segetibacter sp. 3557_3 TaxID=2547429 RepID=UPI001058AB38|nr:phosphoenolpyruvate carboxylase [Segetibacter sp. 3557_3]TDH28964.1 phosphoenolpyruvate carboxylase [Segetibacter sp. 3557_3]